MFSIDDLMNRYPEGASEADKERIDMERFEAALKGRPEIEVLSACQDLYSSQMRRLPVYQRAVIGAFEEVFRMPCSEETLFRWLQDNDKIRLALLELIENGTILQDANGHFSLADERLWKWLVFKTRAFLKAFHASREKGKLLTVTEFLAQQSAITEVRQGIGDQVQAV